MDQGNSTHIIYSCLSCTATIIACLCPYISMLWILFTYGPKKNFPKLKYHFTFERYYSLAIFPEACMKMYDTHYNWMLS